MDSTRQQPVEPPRGSHIPASEPAPAPPPAAASGFWSASMPSHARPEEHAFDIAPPDAEVERAKKKRRIASDRLAKQQTNLTPRLCEYCEYDMSGLPGDKCPECGQLNSKASALRTYDPHFATLQADSRAIARRTYMRPVILAAVGLALMAIGLAVYGQPWQMYAAYSIIWIAQVPLGMLALWISQQFIVDYDGHWPLTTLRFAAIYAIVGNLPIWLPVPFVPAILTYIAYMGLCVTELEVEGFEARVIAAVMWAMGVGAWLAVLSIAQ